MTSPDPKPMDMDELKALASKATPGPWRQEEETTLVWGACDPDDLSSRGMGFPVAEAGLRPAWLSAERASSPEQRMANAAFIAAANPSTVIALIERVESAEESLGLAIAMIDNLRNAGEPDKVVKLTETGHLLLEKMRAHFTAHSEKDSPDAQRIGTASHD